MNRLLLVMVFLLASAAPALAVPVTYGDLQWGTVTLYASQGGLPVGESEPIDLSTVMLTIDEDNHRLSGFSISVSGPATIAFDSPPVNGLDSVSFSDALLSQTPLLGDPWVTMTRNSTSAYNASFVMPSEIGASEVVLNLYGGGGSIVTSLDPPETTTTTGTVNVFPGKKRIDMQTWGVSFGSFDPLTPGGDPVEIEARFSFVADEVVPIPEPASSALFGTGMLIVAGSIRRRRPTPQYR